MEDRFAHREFAMVVLAQDISKLTDRYQTTVPSGVRKQLKLQKGDQIRYCIDLNGRVYIEPVRESGDDPALGAFLDFLETDIRQNPGRLHVFSGTLYDRLNGLVGGVDVDIDDSLSPDDE
jgi:antitoxin PrlF